MRDENIVTSYSPSDAAPFPLACTAIDDGDALNVSFYRPSAGVEGRAFFSQEDGRSTLLVFVAGWEQPTIIDLLDGSVVQEAREVAE